MWQHFWLNKCLDDPLKCISPSRINTFQHCNKTIFCLLVLFVPARNNLRRQPRAAPYKVSGDCVGARTSLVTQKLAPNVSPSPRFLAKYLLPVARVEFHHSTLKGKVYAFSLTHCAQIRTIETRRGIKKN